MLMVLYLFRLVLIEQAAIAVALLARLLVVIDEYVISGHCGGPKSRPQYRWVRHRELPVFRDNPPGLSRLLQSRLVQSLHVPQT